MNIAVIMFLDDYNQMHYINFAEWQKVQTTGPPSTNRA